MIDLSADDITGQKIGCTLDSGEFAVHCIRDRLGCSGLCKPGHRLDQDMTVCDDRCYERVLQVILPHDPVRKIVCQLFDRILCEIEILFRNLTVLHIHFWASSLNYMN